MATDQRFDPYGERQQSDKRQTNWLVTCLIGCLAMVVIGAIVVALVGYWVVQNWRNWMSMAGSQGIMQSVDASDLPEEEKREIEVQVDRVADAFADGGLTVEQVGTIITSLMQSPVLTAIIISTADRQYFDQSGLSDEEKAEGRIVLQRFIRGAIDGEIDENTFDSVLAHIGERQQDGTWRLRNQVTDEQLRAFLAAAKAEADEANIPDEPKPFDPSEEIKRIIDEAMAQPAPDAFN